MKTSIAFIFITLVGCGGFNVQNTPDEPQDTDTSVSCDDACSSFDFTRCTSAIIMSLPVGVALHAEGCVNRCEELKAIYLGIPYEQVKLSCMKSARSCNDVFICFGIVE